jgi:predicted alpha-1,6-mannanase (GH76 family)
MPAQEAIDRARAAIAALLTLYDPQRGIWRTTGWWNAANALGAVIDYMARTGDRSFVNVVANTYEKNRRGRFLNAFYDDEGWWALTWISAYGVLQDRRYLDASRTLFDDMCGGWDGICGGGIWWNKERRYKNAISNELFLSAAARLYRCTEEPAYLQLAQRAWNWFAGSGLVNAQNLVNDGLTPDCRNNGGVTWSYNQGVILGALVSLYESTNDNALLARARAIADAAIELLSDANGVLREPNEPDLGNDGPQFKGIFVRNLYELYGATQEPRYAQFLAHNADAIWTRSRNPSNFLGVQWAGPFDRADAARQSSAIDALNAALV